MRYLDRTGQSRLQKTVVKIEHGKSIGTGFFVLPRIVASCYHVVDRSVTGETKVFSEGHQLTIKEIRYPESPKELDLVLIEVEEEGPKPLPLAQYKQLNTSVYSYGYQYAERGYAGYGVWGEHGGPVYETQSGVTRSLILILRANIQPGLSGGPLYSVAEGSIVGIVNRQNSDGGGYAIPIERLAEIMPEVLELNREMAVAMSAGRESLSEYFEEVSREHEFIAMVDLQRELRLKDIYVSLTFASDSTTGRRLALDATGQLKSTVGEDVYRLDARRDLGSPLRYYLERPVLLQELLPQGKVIILGEPGSGKTTLLRHLIARSCAGELFTNKIPAFIKLADLSNQLGSIQQYLETIYKAVFPSFETAIEEGDMVLFMDGLDEVSKDRQQFLQREINRLAAKHNQIFITCRTAAFPRGLFTSDYRTYECVGFSPVQQSKFLKAWFIESPEKAFALDKQLSLNRDTYGFSRNPLLLSLIAVVVENDPAFKLPNKRAAIYDRAIDLLFERRRDADEKLELSKRQLMNVLLRLSYQMFVQGKETFNEDDLLEAIEQYQTQSSEQGIKNHSAELIAKVIVEKIGIISTYTQDSFRFLHLTFQEYLTAKYLARMEQRLDMVADHILDSRWEEVLRLLSGILPHQESQSILKLIWDEDQSDTWLHDRLYLAGRCAGDAEHIDGDYAGKLTRELSLLVFESDLQTNVDSALASLAHICSANAGCLAAVIRYFHQLWERNQLTVIVLMRYIRLLQFVTDRMALEQLEQLFRSIQSTSDNEVNVQIMGALVNAICRAGHGDMRDEIQAMLKGQSSYLCSAVAQGLSVMQADAKQVNSLMMMNDLALENSLYAAYVLLQSQEADISKRLLTEAFNKDSAFMLQSLAGQCIEIETLELTEAFVLGLYHSCPSSRTKSQLLLLSGLFIFVNDREFIKNLIFNQSADLDIRCAALHLFMNLHPNFVEQTLERMFNEETPTELLRIAIANLTHLGITLGMPYLRSKIGASSDLLLLQSLLRMHTRLPTKQGEEWLFQLTQNQSLPINTRLQALLALAKTESDETMACIQKFIAAARANGNNMTLIVIYKALAALRTQGAMNTLLERLWLEEDVLIINHILEALAEFKDAKVEEALLRCLDPAKWPKGWPLPRPPLRKGEQLPSDRRRLTAILGLDRLSSKASLIPLRHIMEDEQESNELRDAAAAAIHNIAWNINRKLILSDQQQNSPTV
jgi:hypothetical protein